LGDCGVNRHPNGTLDRRRKGGSDSISVQPVGQMGTLIARYCDGELFMPEFRKTARLLPSGLVVDEVTVGPDEVVIAAHALGRSAECPGCGRLSRRVHSRYERYLSDVPAHGRRVRVRLSVRRFRCPHQGCPRKIFAERLESGITRPYARRTTRLQQLVHCLGIALGGRPGQGMARRLLFPVEPRTRFCEACGRGATEARPWRRG
jgi:hypothetical protein